VGEAQQQTPQLVTANFMAASLAAHLYVLWGQEQRKMDAEAIPFLPYKLVNNLTRNEHHLVRDALRAREENQTKGQNHE
jgi:hypothetical protein